MATSVSTSTLSAASRRPWIGFKTTRWLARERGVVHRQRPAAGGARETTADPCLTMGRRECVDAKTAMAVLLREYSTEVSPLDRESIAMAPGLLPPGGEVFINSPSIEASHRQLHVARYLRRTGMIPVPHIVARDIPGLQALENTLARFAGDAGV